MSWRRASILSETESRDWTCASKRGTYSLGEEIVTGVARKKRNHLIV